jgi:hypothetical protein
LSAERREEGSSRRYVDQARDVVNAWANPILLAVIGSLGIFTLHGIQGTLESLQTAQAANNDRLARIETHLTNTDAISTDNRDRLNRIEADQRHLDERITAVETIQHERRAQ